MWTYYEAVARWCRGNGVEGRPARPPRPPRPPFLKTPLPGGRGSAIFSSLSQNWCFRKRWSRWSRWSGHFSTRFHRMELRRGGLTAYTSQGLTVPGQKLRQEACLAGGRKRSSAVNPLSLCASKHQAHARTRWRFSWHTDMPRGRDLRGWVCRRVTACRRRRVATGLRRMFASHEWVGACRDGIRREHTA